MPFLLLIILILLIAIGGHYLLPVLGAAAIASSAIWGVILASVLIFCVGILLFFVFTSIGALLFISLAAFVLSLIALVFFPILFPVLVPLFIVLVVVGIMRRRNQRKLDQAPAQNNQSSDQN